MVEVGGLAVMVHGAEGVTEIFERDAQVVVSVRMEGRKTRSVASATSQGTKRERSRVGGDFRRPTIVTMIRAAR